VAAAGRIEKKRKRKKMNKFVLPSTAAMLILVIAVSSFMPAAAVARIAVAPYLEVVTIPEDDQLRQTGIMGLGLTPVGPGVLYLDLMSQHKLLITLNGLLVSTTGLVIACNVAEKDKVAVSRDVTTGKTISKNRQFPEENLKTVLIDVAQYFVCKPRWKPGGMSVGVLDVYYTGPLTRDFIADHILVVHVTYTVGRQVFYGTEIQDICVLGWAMTNAVVTRVTKTNGDYHYLVDDALKVYSSCEEAALLQRAQLAEAPFQ
jgi:hypothetical protein